MSPAHGAAGQAVRASSALCRWEERALPAEGTARQKKPAQSSQVICARCPRASDSRVRPRVQVTSGNGKYWGSRGKRSHFTLSPLLLCCVPGSEIGRRTCRSGKAAESFPCCNQLPPGEEGGSFLEGHITGLTNTSC